MTPAEFLLARLADDLDALAGADCDCQPGQETAPWCARRLADDIAAKRDIVEDLGGFECPTERADHFPHDVYPACEGCEASRLEAILHGHVLCRLAQPYRWHEDWQEEWAL